jgi:chaperonin GroES
MAKDSLAQGARSATFSAGRAKKDDPIEFHGTVAMESADRFEEETDPYAGGLDDPKVVESDESWQASEALAKLRTAHDISRSYQPMNDRVLIREVVENESGIIQPDAFKLKSNKGEVVAVGSGMVLGTQLVPIPLKPGDIVHYSEYGSENVEVCGEKLLLISAFDIRGRFIE